MASAKDLIVKLDVKGINEHSKAMRQAMDGACYDALTGTRRQRWRNSTTDYFRPIFDWRLSSDMRGDGCLDWDYSNPNIGHYQIPREKENVAYSKHYVKSNGELSKAMRKVFDSYVDSTDTVTLVADWDLVGYQIPRKVKEMKSVYQVWVVKDGEILVDGQSVISTSREKAKMQIVYALEGVDTESLDVYAQKVFDMTKFCCE